MDPLTIEIIMKQRQMELDEELKHIYLLRTVKEPGTGFLKRFKLGFGKVLIAMGTRLKKAILPI